MFSWPVHLSTLHATTRCGRICTALMGLIMLGFSGPAFSDLFEIHSGHSAMWHNAERIGEGWMLEVLDGASIFVAGRLPDYPWGPATCSSTKKAISACSLAALPDRPLGHADNR